MDKLDKRIEDRKNKTRCVQEILQNINNKKPKPSKQAIEQLTKTQSTLVINDVPTKKPYQVHANSRWYSKDKSLKLKDSEGGLRDSCLQDAIKTKQDDVKKEQEEKQ